jgi:hypothetical protein
MSMNSSLRCWFVLVLETPSNVGDEDEDEGATRVFKQVLGELVRPFIAGLYFNK